MKIALGLLALWIAVAACGKYGPPTAHPPAPRQPANEAPDGEKKIDEKKEAEEKTP